MESHDQLKGSHSHPVHTSHITHPHAHGEGARAKKAHRGRGEGFKEDAFRFLRKEVAPRVIDYAANELKREQ